MDLGIEIFSEIGKKKSQHEYSDYTFERKFLPGLKEDFNNLTLICDIILLISLEKTGNTQTIEPDSSSTLNPKFKSDTLLIDLPPYLEEMFIQLGTLSKNYCLRGSSLLEVILAQKHEFHQTVIMIL